MSPISESYERAVQRYGELGLSLSEFTTRFSEIWPAEEGTLGQWIHVEDLYLTTACTAGLETAWQVLDEEYHPQILGWCRTLLRPWQEAEDLADLVWTSLFLPGRNGQPRIGSYLGMCSLDRWLHTIAERRAINYRDQASRAFIRLDPQPEAVDPKTLAPMEDQWSEQRLGLLVRQSIRAVCGTLDEAECRLLLWRFDEEIPLGEIARRLGIHQSNVTRRIGSLCDRLRRQAGQKLVSDCNLDPRVIGECFRLARSGGIPELELFSLIRMRAESFDRKSPDERCLMC